MTTKKKEWSHDTDHLNSAAFYIFTFGELNNCRCQQRGYCLGDESRDKEKEVLGCQRFGFKCSAHFRCYAKPKKRELNCEYGSRMLLICIYFEESLSCSFSSINFSNLSLASSALLYPDLQPEKGMLIGRGTDIIPLQWVVIRADISFAESLPMSLLRKRAMERWVAISLKNS